MPSIKVQWNEQGHEEILEAFEILEINGRPFTQYDDLRDQVEFLVGAMNNLQGQVDAVCRVIGKPELIEEGSES